MSLLSRFVTNLDRSDHVRSRKSKKCHTNNNNALTTFTTSKSNKEWTKCLKTITPTEVHDDGAADDADEMAFIAPLLEVGKSSGGLSKTYKWYTYITLVLIIAVQIALNPETAFLKYSNNLVVAIVNQSGNEIIMPPEAPVAAQMQSNNSTTTMNAVHKRQRRKVLEHKHMITSLVVEGCDWQTYGYATCALPETKQILTDYAVRKRNVTILFAVMTSIMLMFIQFIIKRATQGVARSKDRNLKAYEEAIFKQIACVLLVVAFLQMLLKTSLLGNPLEDFFFDNIAKMIPWAEEFTHVDLVMEYLLVITLTFAACFLVMSIFLAVSGLWISRWLTAADGLDALNVSLKVEGSSGQARYLASRYEFEDAVQQSCVPGLDPAGLYFQNYCRACCHQVAAELVLIPVSTLLLALACTVMCHFLPLQNIYGKREVILFICLSGFTLLMVISISIKVWMIKRKLQPKDVYKYLSVRHSLDTATEDVSTSNLNAQVDLITPPYQLDKRSHRSRLPAKLANCLYGTQYPNSHEALFVFWRKGPGFLVHVCQIAIFAQLVFLSMILTVIDAHQEVWLTKTWPWGPVCAIGLCIAQWFFIPFLLWDLVVVTCTSGLIKDPVVQEVWEVQRARTVQRFRSLIDTLRCETNLYRIERGGRQLRDAWNDRAQLEDAYNLRNDEIAFERLDPDRNGLVYAGHLQRYLVSEGLPLGGSDTAQKWVDAFDRKSKGGLDRDDFRVLAWNVRILMDSELDLDAVDSMLCAKFSLSRDAVVDASTLQKVLKSLGMTWTKLHCLRLIQYMVGQRGATSIRFSSFLVALRVLETNTIGMLRQAVELTTRTDVSATSPHEDPTPSNVIIRNYSNG